MVFKLPALERFTEKGKMLEGRETLESRRAPYKCMVHNCIHAGRPVVVLNTIYAFCPTHATWVCEDIEIMLEESLKFQNEPTHVEISRAIERRYLSFEDEDD